MTTLLRHAGRMPLPLLGQTIDAVATAVLNEGWPVVDNLSRGQLAVEVEPGRAALANNNNDNPATNDGLEACKTAGAALPAVDQGRGM